MVDVGGGSVDGGAEFLRGCCTGRCSAGVIEGEVGGGLRCCISVGGGVTGAARSAMSLFAVYCLRELMIREG